MPCSGGERLRAGRVWGGNPARKHFSFVGKISLAVLVRQTRHPLELAAVLLRLA
jgi:hypothetical protein